jgi:hypothetical protein
MIYSLLVKICDGNFAHYTEHEERQNRLKALRNRQDLFQEEGILNLILDAIDNINTITSHGLLITLASEDSGTSSFDVITAYLYQLLGESFFSANNQLDIPI